MNLYLKHKLFLCGQTEDNKHRCLVKTSLTLKSHKQMEVIIKAWVQNA